MNKEFDNSNTSKSIDLQNTNNSESLDLNNSNLRGIVWNAGPEIKGSTKLSTISIILGIISVPFGYIPLGFATFVITIVDILKEKRVIGKNVTAIVLSLLSLLTTVVIFKLIGVYVNTSNDIVGLAKTLAVTCSVEDYYEYFVNDDIPDEYISNVENYNKDIMMVPDVMDSTMCLSAIYYKDDNDKINFSDLGISEDELYERIDNNK